MFATQGDSLDGMGMLNQSLEESPLRPEGKDSSRALAPRSLRWSRTLAVCIFLVLVVGVVFGQTLKFAFVNYDDDVYVYQNPHVASGLSPQGIHWAFTQTYAGNWHPLTWISHMLDCQLYGLAPGGHHFTNLLLHGATVILLFLVLWKITGGFWRSAVVASVFAIHPLRVESVAWVAERKDVLSGLFFVLTLGAYAGYVRNPSSWIRYLTCLMLFALGLMAKPMLVMLPFVLLLLDYWPLGRLGAFDGEGRRHGNVWKLGRLVVPARVVIEKIPFLALALASSAITVNAQRVTLMPMQNLPLSLRLGNAMVAYVAYLGKLFAPMNLTVFYPHPGTALSGWKVLGAGTLLAIISWVVVVFRKKHPYGFVGWFWFLITLLPVIGLVQVGGQAMADRYTYLTQIGLVIAVVWGVESLSRRLPQREWVCGLAAMLGIVILISCAHKQTSFWRNSEILWNHALDCNSENAVAHNNLGRVLAEKRRFHEAIMHYRLAMDIKPDYIEVYNNLGVALAQSGKVQEAIRLYRKALKLQPNMAETEDNLGVALASRGRIAEAIEHYKRALELRPDSAWTHRHMGNALVAQQKQSEAIKHYKRAVELKPDFLPVYARLAWLLATNRDASIRNGSEAVGYARQTVKLDKQGRPGMLNILAAAYAEAGRFPEAVRVVREATSLAERRGNKKLAIFLRARLSDYEAEKPYRK